MKALAKIINEETNEVVIACAEQAEHFPDFQEMDVEQAYNGDWYVKGFAPKEPETEIQYRIREIRDNLLEQTDKYMIADFPITDEAREAMKEYRQYLREYTKEANWWENMPLDYAGFMEYRAE